MVEVVTVTLNPAIDRTLTLDSFTKDETNRITEKRTDPGGKGINVSRALRRLGVRSMAMGLIGEANASFITKPLQREGIETNFIHCPGETRMNVKVLDTSTDSVTELNDIGFHVADAAVRQLRNKLLRLPSSVKAVVLAGSLPIGISADFYRDIIQDLRVQNKFVFLDTSGEALREGISAKPHLIKPNETEIADLRSDEPATLMESIKRLHEQGIPYVFVSLGARGAVGSAHGETIRATPPNITPGSTVGAGDAMVAGMVFAWLKGNSPSGMLAYGVATGTVAARTKGTQFGTLEEVEALKEQVSIQTYTS